MYASIDGVMRIISESSAVRVIDSTPTQSRALTYNGSEQSPQWSNYNSDQLEIGGITSATKAGSYTATFTPKNGYCWDDGTTTAKNVTWSIAKAAGILMLNKTSLSLTASAKTGTITVIRNSDGAISASSSNTSVATAELLGTSVFVTGIATGTATITVSVAEGTNYTAPEPQTCEVTVQMYDPILDNNSWGAIGQASADGIAPDLWSVGDCKAITLNGTIGDRALDDYIVYPYIIGFNHNAEIEGDGLTHFQIGKTALTAGKDICFVDSYYGSSVDSIGYCSMNASNTNSGGWKNSQMRSQICSNFIDVCPGDLASAIKIVTKYTDNVGASAGSIQSNVTATQDTFFLTGEYEVFGKITYSNDSEAEKQKQYAYYANGNSKIKYMHDSTSVAAFVWLRSPRVGYNNSFVRVYSSGTVSSNNANYSQGVALCFCV